MIVAIVYFALGVLLAGATFALFARRVMGPHLSLAWSPFGLVVGFFIPHLLMGSLGVTLAAVAFGALRHIVGDVAIGLHALSWVVLVLHLARQQDSLPRLDGSAVRESDDPFALGELRPGIGDWARLAAFTYRAPAWRGVEVVKNVMFREVDGVRLRLDVYRARNSPGPAPCAVYIHGGGWVVGTRRQSRFMLYQLALAGWTVFAISYRRAPRFPLPAAIVDCKAAVAWVREHAVDYGASADDVVVIGGSAGGHLAAMVALSPHVPAFQPGFESVDTRVQGAVVLYGVTDLVAPFHDWRSRGVARFLELVVFRARYRDHPERFRDASPTSYVTADAPPMLFVHGESDTLVPIEQSRALSKQIRDAGARSVYLLEVPFGQHAFEVFPSSMHRRAVRVVADFLASVRRRALEERAPKVRVADGPRAPVRIGQPSAELTANAIESTPSQTAEAAR